jgi:hypothetical protein
MLARRIVDNLLNTALKCHKINYCPAVKCFWGAELFTDYVPTAVSNILSIRSGYILTHQNVRNTYCGAANTIKDTQDRDVEAPGVDLQWLTVNLHAGFHDEWYAST